MNERTAENYVVDSIGMAWPTTPIAALQLYTYNINSVRKEVVLKAVLDKDIDAEKKDDVWDIELEISTQLPDEWSVKTIFIGPGSPDFVTQKDTVAFRRGDTLTPRDRLALRIAKKPASPPL